MLAEQGTVPRETVLAEQGTAPRENSVSHAGNVIGSAGYLLHRSKTWVDFCKVKTAGDGAMFNNET